MTSLDATADAPAPPPAAAEESAAAAAGPLAGDPGLVGLPSFIVGSIALGLVLVGVVPATAVGASLPIIMAATSVGLLVATVWAAALGQSAVASVFGIFAGFWASYAVLVLGLLHNWFGIGLTAVIDTEKLFLITWLVVIVILTLATVRLPVAYTAVFGLIDVALLLVLLGTVQSSSGLLKTGGYFVLAFAAVGVYIFFGSCSLATGGKHVPLGQPLMR